MTQSDAILAYLRTGAELDPMTCLQKFGCARLAARIYDLRRQGVQIAERTVRNGRKHWSAYRLPWMMA